jgi:hypothetical protein
MSLPEHERQFGEWVDLQRASVTPEPPSTPKNKEPMRKRERLNLKCDHKGGAEYHCAECCPGCDMHRSIKEPGKSSTNFTPQNTTPPSHAPH